MSGPTVVRKVRFGNCHNTKPHKQMPPPVERVPRITQLLALAIRFEEMLRDSEVESYAEIARMTGVTRARLTQIMNLLDLSPRIHEKVLLGDIVPQDHHLRSIHQRLSWPEQEQTIPTCTIPAPQVLE